MVSTFAGVALVNFRQIFRIGATAEVKPSNVRVSNITDSSFTISWTTDKESLGFVILDGEATFRPEVEKKSFVHTIDIKNLKPNTTYNFKINSDGNDFDNNGIPWQAKTRPLPQSAQNSVIASGSVLTATSQSVAGALVYMDAAGELFSTLTSDSGNYVVNIPNIDPLNTLLTIFVQAGPAGISSAQIYSQSTKPVPPLILGNTHDFRGLPPSSSQGNTPDASLNLPENNESQSKFVVTTPINTPSTETVTLDSLGEGEIITSNQPEFFGKGPSNSELIIKVESENPIMSKVSTNKNGSWKWSPPVNLAPGPHKITIFWKDLSGITHSLTRSFFVQAGEVPAFEASGSAETNLSPSPTPSPSPTAISETPSPTLIPTITPTTPSPAAVPETGLMTPTIFLFTLGTAIVVLSFAVWKYAQSI